MLVKIYRVRITLAPRVQPDEMDDDDVQDPFLRKGGAMSFLVRSEEGAEAAEEAALDRFHETVAIGELEDFDISARTETVSRHEEVVLMTTCPRLRHTGNGAVEEE